MRPTTNAPDLSVVIVTHNSREMALGTLASAGRAAEGLDVEWIIVDCGSRDGTADALEEAVDGLRVIRRANIGFAAGNNVGLARARGRFVLLLNPDVEILAGSFRELVAWLEARPGVGCASVVQRDASHRLQHTIRRFPSLRTQVGEALLAHRLRPATRWQEAVGDPRAYEGETNADWLVGAFLVMPREAVEAAGGLDERFFLYSEEKDLCWRLRELGWEVRHTPVMEILHFSPGYLRPELGAQLTHSKLLFASKHGSLFRRAGCRAALIAHHSVRLVASAFTGRYRGPLLSLEVALGVRRVPPLERSARATARGWREPA